MRDLTDYVVHCYGRQSRAEAVVKHLLEQNPKMRIEVTQDISVAAIKRATDKRQQAQENG
jgi:DNA-directed RNA polymerase subunit L